MVARRFAHDQEECNDVDDCLGLIRAMLRRMPPEIAELFLDKLRAAVESGSLEELLLEGTEQSIPGLPRPGGEGEDRRPRATGDRQRHAHDALAFDRTLTARSRDRRSLERLFPGVERIGHI